MFLPMMMLLLNHIYFSNIYNIPHIFGGKMVEELMKNNKGNRERDYLELLSNSNIAFLDKA